MQLGKFNRENSNFYIEEKEFNIESP